MKGARTFCFLLAAANLFAASGAAAETNAAPTRSSHWAQPFPVPGITNCFRVTACLYRGSQPTAEGMRQLKALGIKSVVNLRSFHSDKDEVAGTDLKNFRITTKPWHVEEKEVIAFLKIMADTNNLPAFIHCQRGADRTGTMCAMYRLTICGWSKEEALAELRNGGFHFASVWKNLVRFIRKADVGDIKRKAGLVTQKTPE